MLIHLTNIDFLDLLSISSNCKIVPLFEKVLSASDAGRIGRLVLPKACAEVSEYLLPSPKMLTDLCMLKNLF